MPGIRTTPTVRALLIVTIAAFVIQMVADTFFGLGIVEYFALTPALVLQKFWLWQFATYMFMHADLFHILFNMLVVWMIGSELEAQWGGKFFLKYYLTCGLSGGVFYFLIQLLFKGSMMMPIVGSSGAVYGLLVAYGIIYSERQLLFMMLFPMKAKYFVLVLAAIEFVSTVFYGRGGTSIANAAHLGGMIVGFAYLFLNAYFRVRAKRGSDGKKRKFKRSHLRLVVNNEVLKEFEDNDEDEGNDDGRPTFH